MDDRIEDVVVEFVAASDPVEPAPAVEFFDHVDAYPIPEAYDRRINNLDTVETDVVEGAQYVFADHVPRDFDAVQEDPNLFYVTYEEGRVQAQLKADDGGREDLLAALEHVLASVDRLAAGHFRIVADVRADLAGAADPTDADLPGEYEFGTRSHPEEARTAVGLHHDSADPIVLADSADPLRDRVHDARAFVADRLP